MNDDFAPYLKNNGCFIVRNITPDRQKTIKIFNYPILFNQTRDILQIPGVSESDIRSSLLKGELLHKLLAKDIYIECSDIDLLQFNSSQKAFLQANGVIKGLQVDYTNINVLKKEDIVLNGIVDDINTTFSIPDGIFIQNSIYKIVVYKNGVKQVMGDDYTIFETSGPGTGYNGILFSIPPTVNPMPIDILTADYYVSNI